MSPSAALPPRFRRASAVQVKLKHVKRGLFNEDVLCFRRASATLPPRFRRPRFFKQFCDLGNVFVAPERLHFARGLRPPPPPHPSFAIHCSLVATWISGRVMFARTPKSADRLWTALTSRFASAALPPSESFRTLPNLGLRALTKIGTPSVP